VAGRHPVREALLAQADRLEKIVLQQGGGVRGLEEIRRLAAEKGVPIQYVPGQRLQFMAGGVNHQGVVAVTAPVAYWTLDRLLVSIAPNMEAVRDVCPLLLILDHIEDPQNFGAMLRSALAMGVRGVVIPGRGMAPLNAAAIKASAGTAMRLPIARVDRLDHALLKMKEFGYWIAGAVGAGDTTVWDVDWERPFGIVIGNESKGLEKATLEVCDVLVRIPIEAAVDSLNASVAAGIVLASAARPRIQT
jgi:23S rRNA (guanosine2251-2'-O)-methyltransferase